MQPGDLISGKYRLNRLLGSGGMGSVWAARNELTDRDFAVKFLLPTLAQNQEALHRFFHEARACGQIKHPAVVDVYDMGQAEDGSPFLVMELLEGEGLDQRLARSGVFRAAEAALSVAFVARGLEEAHLRGLVHRDIKPQNIFYAIDDRGDVLPKLLDFGISKPTGPTANAQTTLAGAVVGSPAYMSPEQAQGELSIDGRSDVWSLGVILYELLTGRVPFDAPNYNALMLAILSKPPRPVRELNAAIPDDLAEIINRALEKNRDKRIQTARELAERLEHSVSKMSDVGAITMFPAYAAMGRSRRDDPAGAGPWSRAGGPRSARTLFAALALSFALVGVFGMLWFLRSRTPMVAISGRTSNAFVAAQSRVERALATPPPGEARVPAPANPAPSASAPASAAAPPALTSTGVPPPATTEPPRAGAPKQKPTATAKAAPTVAPHEVGPGF